MSDALPSPRPRWHVDVPDLTGRRALVTGASDGVGAELARALAGAGAEVVMPVRSHAKGSAVIDRIRAEHPGARVSLRSVDLASLATVEALTRQLLAEGEPIDILVLNAGVIRLGDPVRRITADGHELHLQTNALAQAALTTRVLRLLQDRGSRVVFQLSLAVRTGRVDWEDLELRRGYRPLRAYAASKIALGLFATELARRSEAAHWGVEAVLCHPGIAADTNIAPRRMREQPNALLRMARALVERRLGQSSAEAALPALLAATSGEVRNGDLVVPSGVYEVKGRPVRRDPYPSFERPAEAARMWESVPALG